MLSLKGLAQKTLAEQNTFQVANIRPRNAPREKKFVNRTKPFISYNCKVGQHHSCPKRNCTCTCGHGGY